MFKVTQFQRKDLSTGYNCIILNLANQSQIAFNTNTKYEAGKEYEIQFILKNFDAFEAGR